LAHRATEFKRWILSSLGTVAIFDMLFWPKSSLRRANPQPGEKVYVSFPYLLLFFGILAVASGLLTWLLLGD